MHMHIKQQNSKNILSPDKIQAFKLAQNKRIDFCFEKNILY